VLRSHLRQYDVAARFGGEEFAIVLPETSCGEAHEIAERIRETVAETPFWAESARQHVSATLSIGVACCPEHGVDPDDLLHHADLASYGAKLQGRNLVLAAGRESVLTPVTSEPTPAAGTTGERRERELPAIEELDGAARPAAAGPPEPGQAREILLRAAADSERVGGAERDWLGAVESGRLRWLVGAVGAAGFAAGAVAAVFGGNHDLRGLLVVVGLVALGQAFALDLELGSISAAPVAALAGAAMFGGRAPLVLAATAVTVDVLARRTPPARAFLDLGDGEPVRDRRPARRLHGRALAPGARPRARDGEGPRPLRRGARRARPRRALHDSAS